MCPKHKKFFTEELIKWKKDIIKANNLGNLLNSSDDNVSSADMVDQASSYTDKSVEMKALNRSRKLISKINAALKRLVDGTYGFCEETGEPIGLKNYQNLSRWYSEIAEREGVIKGFGFIDKDSKIPGIV
jgi:DnaK suppressor protein